MSFPIIDYMQPTNNIVSLGGGTGQATLLAGLKDRDNLNLTAIVAVTDNGGSSGQIRRSMDIPQPGDSRNCLVAASDPTNLMPKLFEYRFVEGDLKGTNLGNLIIAALTRIFGDFGEAITVANTLLETKVQVLPVSSQGTQIAVELESGQRVVGEWEIITRKDKSRIKTCYLKDKIQAFPPCLAAISKADLIVIGPGSFYTALISNLLVSGIAKAIIQSPAKVAYVCNLMSQPGQTTGFKASDHIKEMEKYLGRNLDYVLLNTKPIPDNMLDLYKEFGSHEIELDLEDKRIIKAPLAQDKATEAVRKDKRHGQAFQEWSLWTHVLRHDSQKIAQEILNLL